MKLWGFKDCHFGHFDQFGTINARYNSRYQRVSGDLIRLINHSKLVERGLFVIIDLLQGTKSIFLYLIWRVGWWFSQKISNFGKIKFSLYFISFNFLCYYCWSKNLKRQSEPSGLRPDTSSLVVFGYVVCFSLLFFSFLFGCFNANSNTTTFYARLCSSITKPFVTRIVVPTFDTKVTEYLCSGWVFFRFFFFRQTSTF